MNKLDCVNAVANRERVTKGQAERIIDAFLDVVALSLACAEDVLLTNFGKFETRPRRPVVRLNPKTGEPHHVPAKTSLGFRPSPALKQRVNGGQK